jgi:hypothetical protein
MRWSMERVGVSQTRLRRRVDRVDYRVGFDDKRSRSDRPTSTLVAMERQENEENEDYSDEEDEDEELPQDSHIQLGYIDQDDSSDQQQSQSRSNQLFLSSNWKEWDGGCVGGKPVSLWTLLGCFFSSPPPHLAVVVMADLVTSERYSKRTSIDLPQLFQTDVLLVTSEKHSTLSSPPS